MAQHMISLSCSNDDLGVRLIKGNVTMYLKAGWSQLMVQSLQMAYPRILRAASRLENYRVQYLNFEASNPTAQWWSKNVSGQ